MKRRVEQPRKHESTDGMKRATRPGSGTKATPRKKRAPAATAKAGSGAKKQEETSKAPLVLEKPEAAKEIPDPKAAQAAADVEPEEQLAERLKAEDDLADGADATLALEEAMARAVEPKPAKRGSFQKRLFVVLEAAPLEAVKCGREYELLAADTHASMMRKRGRDPTTARPDIAHSSLLMLLDSPLNKAGLLQVYVHTSNNVLIEVNPRIRLPRTYRRFAGLIVQLLNKLSVHAANGPERLMSVVRNPVTQYFPPGTQVVGTSVRAKSLVRIDDFVQDFFKKDEPAAFVIGAFSHGSIDVDYLNAEISFSEYPLSAAVACCKVCSAFEKYWGVL